MDSILRTELASKRFLMKDINMDVQYLNQNFDNISHDMDDDVVCETAYTILAHSVYIGLAIFGLVCAIISMVTVPRMRLGHAATILLVTLSLTDVLILAFQIAQVIMFEKNFKEFSADGPIGALCARRLRLSLYFFKGWVIVCIVLNRFIFVRCPYYEGKYLKTKCTVVSLVVLIIITTALEAPGFASVVTSQTSSTHETTDSLSTSEYTTLEYNVTTEVSVVTTTLELTTEIKDLGTTESESTSVSPFLDMLSTVDVPPDEETTHNPTELMEATGYLDTDDEQTTVVRNMTHNSDSSTSATVSLHTGAVLEERFETILTNFTKYVDRVLMTLVPVLVSIPFMVMMSGVLLQGHPRLRTLSHDVIMERSAVVLMLSAVTWYIVVNLPYLIFSLITWISRSQLRCTQDGAMFLVTTITLACSINPLVNFFVCPHFRRTLGTLCNPTKQKPKESFGTPSFDRISSRVLSSHDLSRDSRDFQSEENLHSSTNL